MMMCACALCFVSFNTIELLDYETLRLLPKLNFSVVLRRDLYERNVNFILESILL